MNAVTTLLCGGVGAEARRRENGQNSTHENRGNACCADRVRRFGRYAQNQEDYINPDRPGIADGSEVVGAARAQLETGVQREVRRAGDDPERKTFLPTLLRVGIGQKWEARIESDVHAWMRQTGPDGMERAQAYAPASLGFKHHFLDADGSARPSLGAIVRVFPPSGSPSRPAHHGRRAAGGGLGIVGALVVQPEPRMGCRRGRSGPALQRRADGNDAFVQAGPRVGAVRRYGHAESGSERRPFRGDLRRRPRLLDEPERAGRPECRRAWPGLQPAAEFRRGRREPEILTGDRPGCRRTGHRFLDRWRDASHAGEVSERPRARERVPPQVRLARHGREVTRPA